MTGDLPRRTVPWLMLAASLSLTAAAGAYVSSTTAAKDQLRFEGSVETTLDAISDRLETYIGMLGDGAAFFAVEPNVTRQQFHDYVSRLDLSQRYPGIQGVGYIHRATEDELGELRAKARAEGLGAFEVWPAGPRPEYHATLYLEPLDSRNQATLGFDVGSEPVRRQALERARDTGRPAASGKVALVQQVEEPKQAGFLIYVPVYRGGRDPGEVQERRARLRGFIYAPFRADDLMRGIFAEAVPRVAFQLFDGPAADKAALLHDSSPEVPEDGSLSRLRRLDVAGRTWTVRFRARPAFALTSVRGLTFGIVAGGLAGSLLVFLLTNSLTRARAAAETSERHYRFLAEAGAALASSLDYGTTLARVARLAVPEIADWCAVDILEPDGALRRLAIHHADPAKVEMARELDRRYPSSPDASFGVAAVLRTGTTEIHTEVTPAFLARVTRDPEHLRWLQGLGLVSRIVVPLMAHGRTLGAITLATAESGRRYGPSEVTLAQELARRCALALESARLFAEAEQSYRRADNASRMKDEFLATLSHELRTPLNSIVGWAAILKESSLDPDTVRKGVETIDRNARVQSQLVADILDVSAIVAGKLRLGIGPVDLVTVVEAAADTVRLAAEAKGLQLRLLLDPAASAVSGDPDRLQQVVWNLLSNAVKFTPRGGRILVRLEPADGHVELTVEDSGPGIDPEFLPHVFERFRQADSSPTRQHRGLGLGLAIVRHLVELHGGVVEAANRLDGAGALFRMTLPLRSAAVLSAPADPRQTAAGDGDPRGDGRPRLDGLCILVVDDEADSREVVAHAFERAGAEVVTAASAPQALDTLDWRRPDVLVSDIEMPGQDGYALIRQIRERPPERGGLTPAAALTGYGSRADRDRALQAGYDLHLAKPVQPGDLVAMVAGLASRGRPQAVGPSAP